MSKLSERVEQLERRQKDASDRHYRRSAAVTDALIEQNDRLLLLMSTLGLRFQYVEAVSSHTVVAVTEEVIVEKTDEG